MTIDLSAALQPWDWFGQTHALPGGPMWIKWTAVGARKANVKDAIEVSLSAHELSANVSSGGACQLSLGFRGANVGVYARKKKAMGAVRVTVQIDIEPFSS